MGATAKYLFDLDLGADPKAEATLKLAEHTVKLAAAETKGYRNGFAAAEAQAKAEIPGTLDRIAASLDTLMQSLRTVEGRLEAEAVEVAVAVARKLTSELIAREPLAEIAALATDCFRELVVAPHVVVRVNDIVYDETRELLENIAHTRGYEGRVVVLAEPEIAAGDCRIEWADGGMTRHRAATETAITEAVGRYVAVRCAPAGGLPGRYGQ